MKYINIDMKYIKIKYINIKIEYIHHTRVTSFGQEIGAVGNGHFTRWRSLGNFFPSSGENFAQKRHVLVVAILEKLQ